MIPIVVMDRESCNRLSLSIVAEPLADTLSSDGGNFLVVADIVTLVPVFHFCRPECFDIFIMGHRLYDPSRSEKFLLCSSSSVIPLFRILAILEECIACLLEMIREIESSPSTGNDSERIRDPCDHRMAYSEGFFEHFDIRFDISTFVFDDSEKISEKPLLPCILWRIPDIECGQSAALEVFAIGVGTRSVVVEIPWKFGWSECNHRETIAENREKGKN